MKAASWSSELVRLCAARGDPHTQLEAEAYSAWMHGNKCLELEDFQEAFRQFSHAKTIYEQLVNIPDLASTILYQEKVAEIAPNLRYCRYVLSRSDAKVDESALTSLEHNPNVQALLASKRNVNETTQASLTVIRWLGTVLTLPPSEKLAAAFQRTQDLEARLLNANQDMDDDTVLDASPNETRAAQFSNLGAAIDEVLSALRNMTVDSKNVPEAKRANLEALKSYCTFKKLSSTLQRNLHLALALNASTTDDNKLRRSKSSELASLYDKALHNVTSMQSLIEDREAGAAILQRLNEVALLVRGFKCFFLGVNYLAQQRLPESAALFNNIAIVLEQAAGFAGGDTQDAEPLLSFEFDIEQLQHDTQAQLCLTRAQSLLATYNASQELNSGMASMSISERKEAKNSLNSLILTKRLEVFDAGDTRRLVNFPPSCVATPSKPILFDLALNEFQFPTASLEERTKQATGWLSGWW
jgi:signal recognition particle subunit SRP68